MSTSIEILQVPLDPQEFFNRRVFKDTIVLHHTAGGHRPDWVIRYWARDRSSSSQRRRVATAFVIGGKSLRDGNRDWDGKILQCFPEDAWAYHLGVKASTSRVLEMKSIGIEMCNYGPLTLSRQGDFFNYVHQRVPQEDVCEISPTFRGFRYFHRYTEAQLEALRRLLLHLSQRFGIDLRRGLVESLQDSAALKTPQTHAFEVQPPALQGQPGLWTHTNFRADKFDCHPQHELLQVLRSL